MIVARSVLMWLYISGSIPVLWVGAALIWLVTAPFDRNLKVLHAYTCLWAAHYLWVSPFWHCTVEGRDGVDSDRPVVFVANHQSLGDILTLFAVRKHYKWVSKQSVFKVPFLGWNMSMNRYVELRRGDKASIERMLAECRTHLESGSSLMIFPEGTRSKDGRMRPFKHGAFTLATECDVPVVPIVVDGTQNALPKHGFLFKHDSDITVRILEPIAPSEVGGTREALQAAVRQRMAEELGRMRGVAAAEVLKPVEPEAAPPLTEAIAAS